MWRCRCASPALRSTRFATTLARCSRGSGWPSGPMHLPEGCPAARAIIARPELLIADEPTGNGGDETALLLVRLFERINSLGTTVLIASDDIAFAGRFAHRRFHLDHGMLVDPDA